MGEDQAAAQPSRVLPSFARFSEFAGGFNGTCTQAALAICIGAAKGKAATQDDMLWLVHDMLQKKLCGPNGASTLAAAAAEARDVLGVAGVAIEWDYADPFGHDWAATVQRYAGVQPMVLQVLNGQALRDAETGVADESGLHCHAVAIGGRQGDGFVCADGDHPQVSQRYQVYSLDTLAAARPCGLLMLNLVGPRVPVGWKDDEAAGRLVATNGVAVVGKFRDLVLGGSWPANDVPLVAEFTRVVGDGVRETYQTFTFSEWRYRSDDGVVFRANVGADLVRLRAAFDALRSAIAVAGGE